MKRTLAGLATAAALAALAACAPAVASSSTGPDPSPAPVAGEVILCAGGDHWDTTNALVYTSSNGDTVDVTCQHPTLTDGTWQGFTVGSYLHCTDGDWESDGRDPGDDDALPDGGWWVHCN